MTKAVMTIKIVELENSQSLKVLIMLYKCANPVYTIISILCKSRRKARKGCPSNDGHPNGKTKVDRIVAWRCVRLCYCNEENNYYLQKCGNIERSSSLNLINGCTVMLKCSTIDLADVNHVKKYLVICL